MADAFRGRFVWHELVTPEPQAAIAFYTGVTGWNTQPWAGPGGYTMWTVGEMPIGGVVEQKTAAGPPSWLGYVSTPDVDRTVAQATGLGAGIQVPPTEIPEIGRFAVLTDPQGGPIAVYSSLMPPADPAEPRPGEFSWHELMTTDPVAAFDFYGQLFGWEKTSAMDMGELGAYQMFGLDGVPFGGMMRSPAGTPGPPFWLHYIMVDDVQRAAEAVKTLGGQVINGPMEVPGGDWIVQCIDPQGAMFAAHARPTAA